MTPPVFPTVRSRALDPPEYPDYVGKASSLVRLMAQFTHGGHGQGAPVSLRETSGKNIPGSKRAFKKVLRLTVEPIVHIFKSYNRHFRE